MPHDPRFHPPAFQQAPTIPLTSTIHQQTALDTFTRSSSFPVGDATHSQWHGDEVSAEKENGITRVMFHNVNGLTMHGPEGFDIFLNELTLLQVDIHCMSEHCLDTTKYRVINNLQSIAARHSPGRVTMQLDSSAETAIHQYKPGGTGIIALGPVTSRLEPHGRGGDPLGRWSYIHLRRKNLPPLTIISAYQVCPTPTNLVCNTAFHQQQRYLNSSGRTGVHPRRAFQEDLGKFIAELLANQHDILLGGDFNESLEDRRSGVHHLTTLYNLIDPYLHRHPQHDPFGTHLHGQRRIDLILMTPNLLRCLRKIGYAPFHYMLSSDHRPIVLELNTDVLFGATNVQLQEHSHRSLQSTDKKAVRTFVSVMYEEISTRGGFSYRHSLEDDTATPAVVELVDSIIGDSGDLAEAKCKKRRPEFFSLPLVQQRVKVSLLRAHLNSLRSQRDRHDQLLRRMNRLGIYVEFPPTQHLTRQALKAARDTLQKLQEQHASLRQEELTTKISNATCLNDKKRAKILKAIQRVENGKQTYRVLRTMKGRTNHTSLDKIEIPASWPPPTAPIFDLTGLEDPKECQEWQTVTDPQAIEFYLVMRNRKHFGQAEGTPFTTSPLREQFDWEANSPASEELLQGNYQIRSSFRACNDLLTACKAATELDSLPAEIHMGEFKGKIKSWKEATTTSPSGRHLGRYKALFSSMVGECSEETDIGPRFKEKQEEIAQLVLAVINYCLRRNHVLNRWKTIVNVMILKEPQNYKIHRLRVIHIYEADFNLILAVMWRKLLHHADSRDLLNEGQYGGRPGCEAQSLTLLEELKYDISYLTRRTLVQFDNDAASCYDRIVVPLASIINRKYGLHRRVSAVHGNTLQQAQFHLKTATGVSSTYYTHCQQFPIHGTGQGSGNSPSIWLLISSTLFDVHASQAQGVTFFSPDGRRQVKMAMVGFVDDATSSCNVFLPSSQPPLETLLLHMERDAQAWNDLLFCSGGRLELSKCSFHVLHFEYKPDGTPIPTLDRYENRIHLQDREHHRSIPIPSKRVFETHKTLGHHKAPSSSVKTSLAEVIQKATTISTIISMSPITRMGAKLAYHTVYLPAIKYTLPQSFYPRDLLDKAQARSMSLIIAKCGFNRKTARAIMFAPTSHAGGGFIPWHVLQGEGQILHLLKHTRTSSIVSRTLAVALEWAQWQSGHETSIFQDTTTFLPHLECRWISSVRSFMGSIQATLTFERPLVFAKERRNDIHIMQYARQCGLFSPKELIIINYCRLYLHLTTVSELFEPDGKTIISSLFDCVREPWFNPLTYVTLQKRPSDYQIRTKWQRLCREWVTSEGVLAASLSLGPWTVLGHQLRRYRQTYATPQPTATVYHWHQDCYWRYIPSVVDPNVYERHSPTPWTPIPGSIPVSRSVLNDTSLRIQFKTATPLRPSRALRSGTFHSYVMSLSQWEQELLSGCRFLVDPFGILHLLMTASTPQTLYSVSDGSHRDSLITYGWVVGTSDGQILVEHSGVGYGHPNSYRAEAWGMLSASLFLFHLYEYWGRPQPSPQVDLVLFADNAALITRLTRRSQYTKAYPNSTLEAEWDVLEQINATTRRLHFSTITYEWVRGHQDNSNTPLTVEAQYNIRADTLAGQATRQSPDHYHQWVLPSEKVRLIIRGAPVSSNYITSIRNAATLPPLFTYLSQRHSWSPQTSQIVDWPSYEMACKNAGFSHFQLCKLVHGKLPSRYELSKSNPNQAYICHHCGCPDTFPHLLRCTNSMSQRFRDSLLEQIDTLFVTHDTPQPFRQHFLSSLPLWLYPPTLHPPPSYSCAAFSDQEEIGWSLLPRGFFATSWTQFLITSPHCFSKPRCLSVISRLIHTLWDAQMDLWQQYTTSAEHPISSIPVRIHDKKQEYCIRIRQLHDMRERCLYSHRSQYFYPEVEVFLQQASVSQMKSYLHHYEPAIQASIKQASQVQLRPLFSFPGFTRILRPVQSPFPGLSTAQQSHRPSSLSFTPASRGTQYPHKHTRWRQTLNPIQSIKSFFPSRPNT